MTDAMERLGKMADNIVPLFITVDPERDKVEDLADYISNFDPRMVGLTGTPEQVRKASKAYRVYSQKVTSDGQTDFDHSAIIFFMGPDGKYVTHFAYGVDGAAMADKIRAIFKKRGVQKGAVSQGGNKNGGAGSNKG
jgi:protein SCO1/2